MSNPLDFQTEGTGLSPTRGIFVSYLSFAVENEIEKIVIYVD